ncbi:MAG TPA: anti-sigma factor [Candidatus Limnocylindrales bacterium]|nr:anti-sigma factor [Candidatus Limnocylindrales bacterium]
MADRELAGLRCSDVLEVAGSFVLGALPDAEADAVRAHLAACPEAHAEVAELGGVVPALFEAVELVPPPAGLRDRIMTAAAAEQRASEGLGAGVVPAAARTVGPSTASDDRPGGFDLGALFRRPAWVGLAAAALVVALGLGAWNLQLRSQVDSLTAYRTGVVEVLEDAARPGAQLAVLVAPNGASGPSGLAAVGADGSVAMVMRELAPTTGTQVYTAWLIGSQGAPIPIGDFKVDDSRTASFTTDHPSLGPGVTVALSLEPRPGATTPTTVVAAGAAEAQVS